MPVVAHAANVRRERMNPSREEETGTVNNRNHAGNSMICPTPLPHSAYGTAQMRPIRETCWRHMCPPPLMPNHAMARKQQIQPAPRHDGVPATFRMLPRCVQTANRKKERLSHTNGISSAGSVTRPMSQVSIPR